MKIKILILIILITFFGCISENTLELEIEKITVTINTGDGLSYDYHEDTYHTAYNQNIEIILNINLGEHLVKQEGTTILQLKPGTYYLYWTTGQYGDDVITNIRRYKRKIYLTEDLEINIKGWEKD